MYQPDGAAERSPGVPERELNISGHGLPAIINQAVRTLLHSSLRYHMKNLQVKYPDVDIVLIQPEWDDQRTF